MGTVNVVLGEDTRLNLILGQQLENAVTEVVFDFSSWQTTYGAGTLALSVQRPGDEMPYAVTLTTSGTNATWSVTNLDTAYKGVGHIQLTYTVGTAIKKSVVYKFTVYESLGANGEYPSPGQTWQEEMEQEITDVKSDLNDLETNLNTFKNGTNLTNVDITYKYGYRLNKTDNTSEFTETENSKFATVEFLEVPVNHPISITISQGHKIYAWCTDVNTLGDATGNYRTLTTSWTTGSLTINCQYKYLCISITTTDNTNIEQSDLLDISYTDKPIYFTESDTEKAIKSDIDLYDLGLVEKVPKLVFKRGRVQATGSTLGVTDSTSYVYCENLKFIEKPITVSVSEGYKLIYWQADNYASEGGTVTGSSSWNTGAYSTQLPKNEAYPFLVLCVCKTAGGNISASEATEAVSVSWTEARVDFTSRATGGQVAYVADTKSSAGNYIVNAVAYDDGVIIACRANGTVVRIGYSNTEEILLTVTGTVMDWRLCWMDSDENVYVSPHASKGTLSIDDRGLYRLVKGANSFTKVISLYNPNSSVETETDSEGNKDTIWTMCEDDNGYLYAGVYAHGTRVNPAIYRSVDGGLTWLYLINFIDAEILSTGARHIHAITYSKWTRALYCIVGEVNTILKSTNNGLNWLNLNVALNVKGTVLHPTPKGLLIGSDGSYNIDIDLLLMDDKTHVNVFNGWANTVFAFRQSDITGWIYAFTKIDISVNETSVFPPITVLDEPTTSAMWNAINQWKTSAGATAYNAWWGYYRSVAHTYPGDSIRPQHYGILVSKDGGVTWEICKYWESTSANAYGIWCVGHFKNGECLCNRYTEDGIVNPVVISELKHKYISNGCDFDGDIFIRTNSTTVSALI